MLKIKNLYKKYEDQIVLSNINLEINQGEILALIGPSGSGKSTLLRCINYLDKPTRGSIIFNDEIITENNLSKIRQKIGMVFQTFNLFPHMTVKENLIFAPQNVLGFKKDDLTKKAANLLKKVGLHNKINTYPGSLSGGQKQRVAIARTLMMDPEVILFDEPTSALDPEVSVEVKDVIKSLSKTKISMILVTHEINFAKQLADRIVFLDHGKIIEEAKPLSFFKSPKTKRAKEFIEKVI